MNLEGFIWLFAVFLVLLAGFLGFRGARNAKDKKISNYGIPMFTLMFNPILWDFDINRSIDISLASLFAYCGVVLTPYFFIFVILLIFFKADWKER